VIWLLASAALAADLQGEARAVASWETLQDALLLEASGDVEHAVDRYEQLVRELGPDDPVRSEALYWLGNARWLGGDVRSAREALIECNRTPNARERCQALLARIELDESSVQTVPTRWTFDGKAPQYGIVDPASLDGDRSLRLDTDPDGDVALVWTTFVDERGKRDFLVVGFRNPQPTPETVRFDVRSTVFDAHVQVWVYDTLGRRFLWASDGQAVAVPTTRWVQVDVDLEAIDGFDPRHIDRIVIEDVTGFARGDGPSGPNALWIDDFEVE
jgi:hypothetical protein